MTVPPARVRVLLVEPDADNRELYTLGLGGAGYAVIAVADATSATAALVMETPVVVVVATQPPEQRAVAVVRRFSDAGVPVIALTTAPLSQHDDLRAAGAAVVLLKPCLPDQLAAVIDGALGGPPP